MPEKKIPNRYAVNVAKHLCKYVNSAEEVNLNSKAKDSLASKVCSTKYAYIFLLNIYKNL